MTPEHTDLLGRPLALGDRIVFVTRRREGSKSTCLATARIVALTPDGKLDAALETVGGEPASGTRHVPYAWRTLRLPFSDGDILMLRLNDYQPFGDRQIAFRIAENKIKTKTKSRHQPVHLDGAPVIVDYTGRAISRGDFVLFKVYGTFLALGVASHTDHGAAHLIAHAKLLVLGNLQRPNSVEFTLMPQNALRLPCDDEALDVFMELIA